MILGLIHRVGVISIAVLLSITEICGLTWLPYNCSTTVQVGSSLGCWLTSRPNPNVFQDYQLTLGYHEKDNFATFIPLANFARNHYFRTANTTAYWTSPYVGRLSYPTWWWMRFCCMSYGDHMRGLGMQTRYTVVNSTRQITSYSSHLITVHDPIKAIQPLAHITLEVPGVIGDNITFVCVFSAFPSVTTISWRDPSRRGIVSPKYDTVPSVLGPLTSRQEIRIHNLGRNDGGFYECTASGGGATSTRSFELQIKIKPTPKNPYLLPVADIEQGRDLTLSCTFEGLPHVEIEWEDPSGRGEIGVRYDLLQSDNSTTTSTQTMVVRDIRLNETGLYKCKANNAVGKVEQSVLVCAIVPPMVRSFFVSNADDQSLSLVCNATGVTPLTFDYFINDLHVQTSQSNQFHIQIVNCTLAKCNYSCEASNSIGRSRRVYSTFPVQDQSSALVPLSDNKLPYIIPIAVLSLLLLVVLILNFYCWKRQHQSKRRDDQGFSNKVCKETPSQRQERPGCGIKPAHKTRAVPPLEMSTHGAADKTNQTRGTINLGMGNDAMAYENLARSDEDNYAQLHPL